jgi:hypothetical protein
VHGRPPAFGGTDGRSYTASTFVDEVPGVDGRHGAALVFVRWSENGARPVGHLETDYLVFGDTRGAAVAAVEALTLREVRAHLDACLARAREAGEAGA